eukprot:11456874-Karenia_brevis.AAC.1
MVMAQMMHKPGSVATSHGLKATPLAWACAFGLAEEERTALGYHVGKTMNATVWAYARDRLAAPLANMDKMLLAMRRGDFDPDEVLPFGGVAEGEATQSSSSSERVTFGRDADAIDTSEDESDDESSDISTTNVTWTMRGISECAVVRAEVGSVCRHKDSGKSHK